MLLLLLSLLLGLRLLLLRRCPGAPEWPAGRRVPVRELLALSTPHYFKLLPLPGDGRQANFSRMWEQARLPGAEALRNQPHAEPARTLT